MRNLVEKLEGIGNQPALAAGRPRYNKINLGFAIRAAVKDFHRRWNALLGLTYESDIDKEHWTRIKALNRRFAAGDTDQYDTLRPSAELRELLKDQIYRTLEAPLGWVGEKPGDEAEVDAIVNAFSKAIAGRLFDPIRERLSIEPRQAWLDAYQLHGSGSTLVRARRISGNILTRHVPIPGATPSPDQDSFLHTIIAAIEAAASAEGIELV